MAISSMPATRLVASTGNDYNNFDLHADTPSCDTDSEADPISSSSEKDTPKDHDVGNFRSLDWSADGTSVVTTSADNTLRTFILPPNLLEPPSSDQSDIETPGSHHLTPYSSHVHPTSIYATALSPYYSISSPETTLNLTSVSSLPIRLISPFASGILATYPLVNPSTEKWIAPHSLLFSVPYTNPDPHNSDGLSTGNSLRFLAGSQNQISIFDVSRDGAGPMSTLATAPGNRKARRGGSTGMSGIVSTMAMSCDGILAAGTFSRGLGLYDSQGIGDTIGAWTLTGTEDGSGITSLHWSKCGRYLIVAERGSEGLGLWDIRGTGRRLAWLAGRKAVTMQRLGVALGHSLTSQDGDDVYTGGVDGSIQVWTGVGMKEGLLHCDWQWQAHEDAVSGLGVHACGSVVASCSGSRQTVDMEHTEVESGSEDSCLGLDKREMNRKETNGWDNSIRVWSLESRA